MMQIMIDHVRRVNESAVLACVIVRKCFECRREVVKVVLNYVIVVSERSTERKS